MKKAIIFDFDGTLVDTSVDLHTSLNHALVGCGFQPRSISEAISFIGNGIEKLVHRALPENQTEEDFNNCLEVFKTHYHKHKIDNTMPYPGMIALLEKLKSDGYFLGLISNKTNPALQELTEDFFPNTFDFVLGAAEGMNKKPDSQLMEYFLEKHGFTKEEAVYIGDSEVDVEFCHNSNVDFIGVSWGFRGREVLSKLGVEKIADFPFEISSLL